MKRRRPTQIDMKFPSWGGKREGAGRPRVGRGSMPHRQREALASRFPVHVTLRVVRQIRGLRYKSRYRVVRNAFVKGCLRENFRITNFSVLGDHIHMIAEAKDAGALARGIQGFKVRVARGLNGLLGRKGGVFAERYHSRILRTPREVRSALAYVLNNARRHGYAIPKGLPDRYSSWAHFTGWRGLHLRRARRELPKENGPPPVAEAVTWLLRDGWRKHHPRIHINEISGPETYVAAA